MSKHIKQNAQKKCIFARIVCTYVCLEAKSGDVKRERWQSFGAALETNTNGWAEHIFV